MTAVTEVHRQVLPRVGLVFATLAVSAGLFAMLAGSANASTFANRYGMRFLESGQCCNNAALDGTRASIIPNYVNPGASYCTAFRSDGEGAIGSGYLIQAGVVKCGVNQNVDGTCSLSNNLVKFVETETPSDGYVCYPHGGTSTGTAVDAAVTGSVSNPWTAWLDGTQEEAIAAPPSFYYLVEGAEHAGTDSCDSSNWGGTNEGTFGSTEAWARNTTSMTWYTVQGSSTSSGCWTVSGGPPGSFTISFG